MPPSAPPRPSEPSSDRPALSADASARAASGSSGAALVVAAGAAAMVLVIVLATVGRLTTATPAGTSASAVTARPDPDPVSGAAPASRLVVRAAHPEVTASEVASVTAAVTPEPGAPPPTGAVVFTEGSRRLVELPLQHGSATFETTELPVGTHELTASYGGDGGTRPSTSSVVLTVIAPVVPGFAGGGPTVAVAGDSITLGSKDDITAGLRAVGTAPAVVGLYGYTTTSAKPFVDAFIPHAPATVIVELGTNDVAELASGVPDRSPQGLQARMRALTGSFPRSCVAVTTVTSHRVLGSPGIDADRWNELARSYNDWLHASYANVVDWDQAVQDAAARGEALVQPDELHPTAAGARALAALDVLAAARCERTDRPA